MLFSVLYALKKHIYTIDIHSLSLVQTRGGQLFLSEGHMRNLSDIGGPKQIKHCTYCNSVCSLVFLLNPLYRAVNYIF